MRVLSYLNISNPDDLAADSGVIFQQTIAEAFRARGDEFAVVGHGSAARLFTNCAKAIYFPIEAGTTKYASRYHFSWPDILGVITAFQPDVLFVNQIELCPHFRALLASTEVARTPVVGYCHYVPLDKQEISSEHNVLPDSSLSDCGLGECMLLACAQGVLAADVVMVQSEYAKRWLLTLLGRCGIGDPNKLIVAPPPADPRFVAPRAPAPPASRKVIYNHRLYRHYNTMAFVEFIMNLRSRLAFELVFCDPMPNRSEARNRVDDSVAKLRRHIVDNQVGAIHPGSDRQCYRRLLENARLGFSTLQRGCVWSMAVMDLMGLGIPVVAPRFGAYPEFVPESLIFDSLDDAETLVSDILTDDDRWREASESSMAASRRYTADAFRETFLEGLSRAR